MEAVSPLRISLARSRVDVIAIQRLPQALQLQAPFAVEGFPRAARGACLHAVGFTIDSGRFWIFLAMPRRPDSFRSTHGLPVAPFPCFFGLAPTQRSKLRRCPWSAFRHVGGLGLARLRREALAWKSR